MQIFHGIEGLLQTPPRSVMTIGNFDGVHRGHQHILQTCRQRRQQSPGASWVVVTFEPHPLTVLKPSAVAPRLTPADMKQELIAAAGADAYVVLPPTPQVLNLTAADFWAILRDQLRPAWLIEGTDFTFGKSRGGDIPKLTQWAQNSDVRLQVIQPLAIALLDLTVATVSSSLIRWLLSHGRAREAAICLARPYALRGQVVKGFGRGAPMGIPTANIDSQGQLIPADGVYAGRCRLGQTIYPAAISIGNLPTFDGGVRQIEAHLLDYEGDLYDQTLDIQFLDWLREQRKFSSVAALKERIDLDVAQTRARSAMDACVPIAAAELANVR